MQEAHQDLRTHPCMDQEVGHQLAVPSHVGAARQHRHEQLRVSFEMRQNSGGTEIRPALRMSNDTQQWDTPVAIGAATRTTEGVTYGDDYVDVSTTTKAKVFAQLGIECKNTSGAGPEMCMAALKVDIKEV